jgi:hypothetical protein
MSPVSSTAHLLLHPRCKLPMAVHRFHRRSVVARPVISEVLYAQ